MRPTTGDDHVFDFNALLHPGTVFEHPNDVVRHSGLTVGEKRAILASWASDASAIASCPSMRSPAGLKRPVSIDEGCGSGIMGKRHGGSGTGVAYPTWVSPDGLTNVELL
jgi:hypothetical protein